MKRMILAVLGAGAVFAASMASASALQINAGVAQAGESASLSCDTNGITIVGLSDETDEPGGFYSYHVKVTDVSSACAGYWLVVRANDSNGDAFAKGQLQIPAGTTSTDALSVPWTRIMKTGDGADTGKNGNVRVNVESVETVSFLIG